jgi:hypothetical protein
MNLTMRTTFVAVLLLLAALSFGQVTTATFYGTVTDASQAVIPGVTVTLTHQGTGTVISKITDERGEFGFTFLQPGAYALKIELTGFKTYLNSGFELGGAQNVRQAFVLEVGGAADQVTVTGEVPLVNAVAPDQRTNYSNLEVREVPLNSRDFTGLLVSNTGVNYSGTSIRMNGMGGAGTRVTVDGTEATANPETSGTQMFGNFNKMGLIGLDAIGEMQTTKGIIPAEYSGTLTGNVSVLMKSGTNSWHGTMFENYSGAALNARNQEATTKPPYTFNQFGGTMGGPIKKNKMFIFGGYEGYRQAGQAVQQGFVPTPRLRSAMVAAVPAYQQYVDYVFPMPNQPFSPSASAGLYIGAFPDIYAENHFDVRWDTLLVGNNNLSVSYSRSGPSEQFYQLLDPTNNTGSQDRVNATYVMAHSSWTSETRVGYNYASNLRVDGLVSQKANGTGTETYLAGLRIGAITGLTFFVPNISYGKYALFAGSTYTAEHKVSKIIGKHGLKFGANFASRGTGHQAYATPSVAYGSEAGLLADTPSSIRFNFGQNPFSLYIPEWGLFLQDDWRATSKLTLNLGIRYDWYGNPVLKAKNASQPAVINTFAGIIDTNNFIFGPLRPQNDPVDPAHLNVGPRFGFAYNVDGKSTTIVRGGFGVMFSSRNNSAFAQAVGTSLVLPTDRTFTATEVASYGWKYPTYLQDAAATMLAQNQVSLGIQFAPNMGAPYMMNTTLGIQRALSNSLMFETAFVGNRGIHFIMERYYNRIDRVTGLRPNPNFPVENQFYDDSQSTLYASWQSSLRKRFSKNVSFNLHYTWGKGLAYQGGDAAGYQDGDASKTAFQSFNNWKINRSPVTGDVNHALTGDWVVQLPAFAMQNRILRQAIGGWQGSGLLRAQSGSAFDVTELSPGGPDSRPDIVDIKHMYLDNYRATGQYLNPAAFAKVPTGSVSGVPIRPGSAAFMAARGPAMWNIDLGLGKSFQIRENVRFESRVNMFNSLNHTNFGIPTASINSASFGQITTTLGTRVIQLQGRLTF